MNKLLKDAIADAKAVRETALANAKLALEEAFAPQMNKIFSEKIKMEMGNDPEETEEGTYMEDEMAPENEMMNPKDRMKELAGLNEFEDDFDTEIPKDPRASAAAAADALAAGEFSDDELAAGEFPDDEDTGYGDDDDEDLEEIIRQLEEDDMEYEMAPDLEEDLGLFEADDDEEKGKMEEDLDEEINLDEVIAALREDDGDFEDGENPEMEEGIVSENAFMDMAFDAIKSAYDSGLVKGDPNDASTWVNIFGAIAGGLGIGAATAVGMNANTIKSKVKNALDKVKSSKKTSSPEAMQELEEAYSVIEHLREKINEVNLLNAKLLYVNKLFKKHSLSESEKVRVVETFDRAATVRETKLIYTTLSESFSTKATKKTKVMTEGFASSPVKKTQILTESNSIVSRFQKLAGLTNEE